MKRSRLSFYPRGAWWCVIRVVVLAAFVVGSVRALAASPHEVIVVSGHPGEVAFEGIIRAAAERWVEAGKKAGHQTHWIGDAGEKRGRSDGIPGGVKKDHSSTPEVGAGEGKPAALEVLKKTLQTLPPDSAEPVWLVLIGHGNAHGRSPKFALEGPDLSVEDLAKWLEPLQRPVVVVAGFAGAGAFVKPLAGKNRVVVAGTRSGDEENWVRFSEYFSIAISGTDADWDGDGQVSVFEAWLHATQAVEGFYKESGRMVTEHAVLEDSGDGRAVGREAFDPPSDPGGGKKKNAPVQAKVQDGALSRQWCLLVGEVEGALTAEDRVKRQELEGRLAALREAKSGRTESDYWREVEIVLLELESVYRGAKERSQPRNQSGPH